MKPVLRWIIKAGLRTHSHGFVLIQDQHQGGRFRNVGVSYLWSYQQNLLFPWPQTHSVLSVSQYTVGAGKPNNSWLWSPMNNSCVNQLCGSECFSYPVAERLHLHSPKHPLKSWLPHAENQYSNVFSNLIFANFPTGPQLRLTIT